MSFKLRPSDEGPQFSSHSRDPINSEPIDLGGNKVQFSDTRQFDLAHLKEGGKVSFSYQTPGGPSKKLSIQIGEETPLFEAINDVVVEEGNKSPAIKVLILSYIETIIKVNDVAQDKFGRITAEFEAEGSKVFTTQKNTLSGRIQEVQKQLDEMTGKDRRNLNTDQKVGLAFRGVFSEMQRAEGGALSSSLHSLLANSRYQDVFNQAFSSEKEATQNKERHSGKQDQVIDNESFIKLRLEGEDEGDKKIAENMAALKENTKLLNSRSRQLFTYLDGCIQRRMGKNESLEEMKPIFLSVSHSLGIKGLEDKNSQEIFQEIEKKFKEEIESAKKEVVQTEDKQKSGGVERQDQKAFRMEKLEAFWALDPKGDVGLKEIQQELKNSCKQQRVQTTSLDTVFRKLCKEGGFRGKELQRFQKLKNKNRATNDKYLDLLKKMFQEVVNKREGASQLFQAKETVKEEVPLNNQDEKVEEQQRALDIQEQERKELEAAKQKVNDGLMKMLEAREFLTEEHERVPEILNKLEEKVENLEGNSAEEISTGFREALVEVFNNLKGSSLLKSKAQRTMKKVFKESGYEQILNPLRNVIKYFAKVEQKEISEKKISNAQSKKEVIPERKMVQERDPEVLQENAEKQSVEILNNQVEQREVKVPLNEEQQQALDIQEQEQKELEETKIGILKEFSGISERIPLLPVDGGVREILTSLNKKVQELLLGNNKEEISNQFRGVLIESFQNLAEKYSSKNLKKELKSKKKGADAPLIKKALTDPGYRLILGEITKRVDNFVREEEQQKKDIQQRELEAIQNQEVVRERGNLVPQQNEKEQNAEIPKGEVKQQEVKAEENQQMKIIGMLSPFMTNEKLKNAAGKDAKVKDFRDKFAERLEALSKKKKGAMTLRNTLKNTYNQTFILQNDAANWGKAKKNLDKMSDNDIFQEILKKIDLF